MKTVILVTTYNEAENIEKLIRELSALHPDYGILVVDDTSPDGTHEIVRRCQGKFPLLKLVVRKEQRGRGYAEICGFRKFLELGADNLVEMDADFSHPVESVSDLAGGLSSSDVVIGSRYVEGGSDTDRNIIRRFISFAARNYLKAVLGVKVKDPTSGFRAFRRHAVEAMLPHLKSDDAFIITETLYLCRKNNFSISEVPISFIDRKSGKSKMRTWMLLKYLFKVIGMKINNP